MTITEFKSSLIDSHPPSGISVYLQSLWHDGKGDWHKAHSLVDSMPGADAAHVHAYLHRKEGDLSNADYWYRRANQLRPPVELDQEWETLVQKFLQEH
jgi:hypothetical protein